MLNLGLMGDKTDCMSNFFLFICTLFVLFICVVFFLGVRQLGVVFLECVSLCCMKVWSRIVLIGGGKGAPAGLPYPTPPPPLQDYLDNK